jgi:hypothetical protein
MVEVYFSTLKIEAGRSFEVIVKVYQTARRHISEDCKGGRTPTASRQASRHETKETKVDVSIMTETGVRRFS